MHKLKKLTFKWLIAFMALCAMPSAYAQAGPKRTAISACWSRGAINEFMMLQCSGMSVPPLEFSSCMNGGPCLGEPPIVPPRAPFCGAFGFAPCPAPSPCGFINTVACPPPPGVPPPPFLVAFSCGAVGTPACSQPQPCGMPNTFSCLGPTSASTPIAFATWQPTVEVALPSSSASINGNQIRFANTPLPNIQKLRQCHDDSDTENEFYSCMVEDALPPAYRLTKACLEDHSDDAGAAFICSTNNDGLMDTYKKVREVQDCAESSTTNEEIATCLGEPFLGQNERYYANCLAKNANSLSAAAVCAMAKDLTAEQQIALSCAMTTGGEPYSFAACAGGQLATREIDKCWQHGIGTEQGCFGPNNEFRKFWTGVDGTLRSALGENNELYKAFNLYKNNVLAPGPNHEFVRAANTALNDLQNGPGPNNDIVRAGNQISQGLQSVGNAVGRALGF